MFEGNAALKLYHNSVSHKCFTISLCTERIYIFTELCPGHYSTPTTSFICENKNGTEINCDEVLDGCTLRIKCKPFYTLPDFRKPIVYCHDGNWSSPIAECKPGNNISLRAQFKNLIYRVFNSRKPKRHYLKIF